MSRINFQWNLTEENFSRMYTSPDETDIFGSVRFGEYLVEFRMTNPGLPDDEHHLTTDVYHYGEEGDEQYFLADDTPYHLLDEEFDVPKRRSLEGFMRAVENEVIERITTRNWCGFKSEIMTTLATKPTLSYEAWNPVKKKMEAMLVNAAELRIPTEIGDIVVSNKGYGAKDGYPGVWVGIERKGQRFDVAMVEVDQEFDEEDGEEPLLKCHVYCTDPAHDDPIFAYHANAAEIDEFLKDNE